jgi:hypothetical protein
MGWATIEQKLRPIKIAFLVNPSDKKALLKVIQLNTFLWGGRYNFIVPVYKKLPKHIKRFNTKLTAESFLSGYLSNFDPDFIVKVSNTTQYNAILIQYKEIEIEKLYSSIETSGLPEVGVGLYDLLNDFIEKELKFKRNKPIELHIPNTNNSLLMSALFGLLSSNVEEKINGEWRKYTNHRVIDCNLDNYHKLLEGNSFNLLKLSGTELERETQVNLHDQNNIFLLDINKPLDIIDFWNLRASGRRLFPFPIELINSLEALKGAKKFALKYFIKTENYRREKLEFPVSIVCSRNVDASKTKDLAEGIRKTGTRKVELVLQNWYPRMWEEWGSSKDGVTYVNYYADRERVNISIDKPEVRLEVLTPGFLNKKHFNVNANFANDINLQIYDYKGNYAEVIPVSREPFIDSMDCNDEDSWKSSRQGLTYFVVKNVYEINFKIPKSEDIFVEWLTQNDIRDISFSKSSAVSKRLIEKMDSVRETHQLAQLGSVRTLEKIGEMEFITRSELFQTLHINGILKPQNFVNWLVKVNALRFGFRLKCPLCNVYKWYSLKDLSYDIECQNCLSMFKASSDSGEFQPAYKAVGPFTTGNQTEGVFSVLLTHRFFDSILDSSVTSVFGFKSENEFEVDLGVFYRNKFLEQAYKLAFAECKTFKDFDEKDIDRMEIVANKFPGAQIVFATLKSELTSKEIELISKFAIKKRAISTSGFKPKNEVIILTGNELFSVHRVEDTWSALGDKYKEFVDNNRYDFEINFWDMTQQLYLNLGAWDEWVEKKYLMKKH